MIWWLKWRRSLSAEEPDDLCKQTESRTIAVLERLAVVTERLEVVARQLEASAR